MTVVDLKENYQVAGGPVILSVVIGDAQIGASIVKLDGVELGSGDISHLNVGHGPNIRGKLLTVKANVTDVNDATNHMSITYQLRGGTQNRDFVSDGIVDNDGDSIIFRANFPLV